MSIFKVLIALLFLASMARAENLLGPAGDRAFLERVIAQARPGFTPPKGITGITVPHHLLAADLIARGFWAASGGEYERIIVLGPDHFRAVQGKFATSAVPQSSVFGTVQPDQDAVAALLARDDFEVHPDPGSEHAIAALVPFIARFFPEARIVPVYLSISARPADWAQVVSALGPLVTGKTLILQSTDYSHYRPVADAVLLDQETLALIASGKVDLVQHLHQPGHLDARGAQYVQMRLQQEVMQATSVVIGNRNSVAYGSWADNTTSYVVSAYHRDPAALSTLRYADHAQFFLGGDVLIGRYLEPVLSNAEALGVVLQGVVSATAGAPLVANLEGVLFPEPVINAGQDAHVMHLGQARPVLRNLNVVALSLANNHTWDFGAQGYQGTRAALRQIGIKALPHGQIVDIGPARIAAVNFLQWQEPFVTMQDGFEWICNSTAEPPLIAFVHWGVEFSATPGAAEREVATRLAACGVSAVIGAHSHQASKAIKTSAGRMPWVFSLGNLLFDQSGTRASGALAEVRVFEQGTIALRLVPIGNLFDRGLDVLRAN